MSQVKSLVLNSCKCLLCLAPLILSASIASGQIQLSGLTYSQDFNSLSNAVGTTVNNLTIPGWQMTESGAGARDNEQYAVDTGGSTTGDTYSYGAASNTERALGQLRSGTLIPLFGANFQNASGAAITDLQISYAGELWRLGSANGRTDRMNFEYSVDATSLTTGSWTGFSALDFITPNTNAVAGAMDGNLATNRFLFNATISGFNIADGAQFWIRWNDTDASGADDGLAIDDFTLSTTAVPEPSVWALASVGVFGLLTWRRRQSRR